MRDKLSLLIDPDVSELGDNSEQFLHALAKPTAILLTGQDSIRCRALVTLLHGNEPSGVEALFRWLRSGLKPAVNLLCIIPSVEAAKTTPVFSHRMLPGKQDLNRCFNLPVIGGQTSAETSRFADDISTPASDDQLQLAQEVLDLINEYHPEAILDLHNTSGSGPAFAVAMSDTEQHQALASFFTQRLIITDLKLGSLMEQSNPRCPVVTIECGGRLDDAAHQLAWEGMPRYFMADQVLTPSACDLALDLMFNPVRLELKKGVSLSYQLQPSDSQLTLLSDIEHLNSGIAHKGCQLGWLRVDAAGVANGMNKNGQDNNTAVNALGTVADLLQAQNSLGQDVLDQIVYLEDDQLCFAQDLILFMVTTDSRIAQTDCLFYATQADGKEIGR